jgi:hypothetical protein
MSTSLITPMSIMGSIGEVSPPYSGWQQGIASGRTYNETPLNNVSHLPHVSAPDMPTEDYPLGTPVQVDKQSGRVPPTRATRPRPGKAGATRHRIKREFSDESDDDLDERPNTLGFSAE